ncbi:MAG: flagella synthesis protein FlgN [Methylophilaceae bacterium]
MDFLQQEQAALDGFINLLQQEQEALVAANVEKLQSLSELKQKHSELLNNLAQQRVATLERAGFKSDAAGVAAWLASQPASVKESWKKLLEGAQVAQQLNQTNGKLIQTHMQHNQQALSALMNAANRADVYGADGQPRTGPGPSQRIIGKV